MKSDRWDTGLAGNRSAPAPSQAQIELKQRILDARVSRDGFESRAANPYPGAKPPAAPPPHIKAAPWRDPDRKRQHPRALSRGCSKRVEYGTQAEQPIEVPEVQDQDDDDLTLMIADGPAEELEQVAPTDDGEDPEEAAGDDAQEGMLSNENEQYCDEEGRWWELVAHESGVGNFWKPINPPDDADGDDAQPQPWTNDKESFWKSFQSQVKAQRREEMLKEVAVCKLLSFTHLTHATPKERAKLVRDVIEELVAGIHENAIFEGGMASDEEESSAALVELDKTIAS